MYNEKLKHEFVEFYDIKTCDNFIETLFQKSEPYEIRYQKDVCNFTKPEIIELLRSIASSSAQTLRGKVSVLRTYSQWCLGKNMSIDNMNHYMEINTDDLYSCINKTMASRKYISRETLYNLVDDLYNPSDKFILLALFEGLKGKDYIDITCLDIQDLDTDKCIMKLPSGRELKVSKKLMNIAYESATTYEYYSLHKGNDSMNKTNFDESSTLVLKPRDNVTVDDINARKLRLKRKLLVIKADLDTPELTMPRLLSSGFLDCLTERASEMNMKPNDLLRTSSKYIDVLERYGMENVPQFRLNDSYGKYLDEYAGV